jgi:hypothetical protein
MGVGCLRCPDYILVGLFDVAVGDIISHRVIKQDGLLCDNADLPTQRLNGDMADVMAVN